MKKRALLINLVWLAAISVGVYLHYLASDWIPEVVDCIPYQTVTSLGHWLEGDAAGKDGGPESLERAAQESPIAKGYIQTLENRGALVLTYLDSNRKVPALSYRFELRQGRGLVGVRWLTVLVKWTSGHHPTYQML